MPRSLLIFSQSDYLLQFVDTNSNTESQTVQIQISWLLHNPTDLDLHCLQRQGISKFSRIRVKYVGHFVPSPREMCKRIRRANRCEEKDRENANDSAETEKIKALTALMG